MNPFKKLAGDTALYGISTILPRLLNYALVPIQTYAFARPRELSSNVEFYSYIALLLVIYTFGLETAFFRYAARSRENDRSALINKTFNETLSIVLVITLTATAVLLYLAPNIAVWRNYPSQTTFIRWSVLIVAIDAIIAIPFARLRVENRARQFVKAKLLNIIIVIALNVFFLVICPDIVAGKYFTTLRPLIDLVYDPAVGPGYIFLANLLGNAFYFVLLSDTFRGFRFRLNPFDGRMLLIYAFPIMLTGLANVINSLTDRLFLRDLLPEGFYAGLTNEDVLGIYGNCFKLSVFMALATQSFRYAADPFFFARAEDKNAPELLARVTKWFTIVCVLIWVGVSLNVDVIGMLMLSAAYRQGLDVVPVLLLGNLFLGVYQNVSLWFKLTDKTKYGTLITVVGATITIIGNIILIPIIGYMGCAVAFLTSSFVMLALCYVLGDKYYPVPYDVGSAVGYVTGAGLLIWATLQFPIANLWVAVSVHVALFGLFTAVVLFVERNTLRPLLTQFRRRTEKPVSP